ncbi:nucleotidyltransferase family protein [Desulfospira joergensenii]|uniref:nucleotidyltransferase family protein n=1 Tax=Desulfospira joergensenii TaxID=53329 RepID=UPI0003B5572B|nr:nucleotidyltransferase family protein [Desulfospira joergensenii]
MKNITIQSKTTVKEAMEVLNKTAEKVLLVVDQDKKLIGSLTDGDIRRHILKNKQLTDSIETVYNPDPYFIFQKDFDKDNLRKILTDHKIDLIPILNNERVVIDYITWEKAFGNLLGGAGNKISAPVVIMAGGKGTRLEPFTKVLPKPLIPVGDKPVIDHIIERFRAFGANQFFFTINYMAKIMRAYFEEKEYDYKIDFAQEKEFRGTAGSLKLLQGKLEQSFFVSNCDIIIEADYSDIYRFHIKNEYDITLVAATKQYNIPYGVCELNGSGSLKRIREKPEYNFLVNTGLYVLNPDILSFIPDHGIFHITHLMESLHDNGGSIGVYPVSDSSWIDVGQWSEYRKAIKIIESL